jgi:Tol biopolymer transport system component
MRKLVVPMLAIALSGALVTAQSTTSADVLFKSALHAEEVQGDLRAAIAQYQKVVDTGTRVQAAQALIRMAECHQKLGNSESRKIYERLVREYADQRDVATVAQARLGATASTATTSMKGDRPVWTGKDVDMFGTVSPDGRYISFVDWGGVQNVVVHDLLTGVNRPLTRNTQAGELGWGEFSAISRQGDRIAYHWQHRDRRREVRIASLTEPGIPSYRTIHASAAGDAVVSPIDWSPDGKWLAVTVESVERSTQLGLLSTVSGELRVLKTVGWRGITKVAFSPDGRFIAYDLADETRRAQSRIFAMAVDASREVAVVDDGSWNSLMGWAADGRLVFSSDRSGEHGLWTMPIANGQPQAPAVLAKNNIGANRSLGLTSSGTLYVWRRASPQFVKAAPFDLATGTMTESGAGVFQRFVDSRGRPRWSADGKHLIFMSCGAVGGGPCRLFIRSGDATAAREVPHTLNYLGVPDIAPDGHAVVADGSDRNGKRGLFLIDTTTGQTTPLQDVTADAHFPAWSSNRTIQFTELRDPEHLSVLMELDLTTNNNTEIYRVLAGPFGLKMSPDRRSIAFVREQPTTRQSELVVVPVGGGTERVVFSSPIERQINPAYLHWLPDSQGLTALIYVNPGTEPWFVPLNGSPRRLLAGNRHTAEGVQLSPDGKTIAFAANAGDPGDVVWALENFLPKK